MVPFLYSTDFQVLGPGSISIVSYTLYSYCITLPYNTCVLQYCVTLYYYFQFFFTYFPANFSKITPHSFKADLELIHVEGSKLIGDRY